MAESIQDRYNPSRQLKVNEDGSIDINSLGQFIIGKFDYIGGAFPDSVTEVYTYKEGGSSGTLVATVTVVYTDANKNNISSITKT